MLLVSGTAPVSRAIKLRTCAKWRVALDLLGCPTCYCINHVGTCAMYDREPMVFESTTQSKLPCAIRKRRHDGVQAHRMADWLAHVGGRVWVASLQPWYALDAVASQRLTDFFVSQLDVGYDVRGAIEAGVRFPSGADPALWYCSEISKQGLMAAGAVPRGNPSCTPVSLISGLVRDGIYAQPRLITQ